MARSFGMRCGKKQDDGMYRFEKMSGQKRVVEIYSIAKMVE